jgi:hypothetical protein
MDDGKADVITGGRSCSIDEMTEFCEGLVGRVVQVSVASLASLSGWCKGKSDGRLMCHAAGVGKWIT